jgi:hypothetical protein
MNEAIKLACNEPVTFPEAGRPFPFASARQAARHAMFEAASRVLTYHTSRLKLRVNEEKKALHIDGGAIGDNAGSPEIFPKVTQRFVGQNTRN